MRKAITILLTSLLFQAADAQIQFWNLADVEDEAQVNARKVEKVRLLSVYRTDEKGARLDSSQADEKYFYDREGRITVHSRYKFNWKTKNWGLLTVDSFFYTPSGILSAYRSYEGPYYNPSFETTVKFNARGQVARRDHYVFANRERIYDRYEIYLYDAKGLIKTINTFFPNKKPGGTVLFFYNSSGKLVKANSRSMELETITEYSRGTKNELTGYKEFYGKELQKTISYSYDEMGRRTRSQTVSSGYDDFTEYRYPANSNLVSSTYLQYSGPGGKSDRRHEYRELIYLKTPN